MNALTAKHLKHIYKWFHPFFPLHFLFFPSFTMVRIVSICFSVSSFFSSFKCLLPYRAYLLDAHYKMSFCLFSAPVEYLELMKVRDKHWKNDRVGSAPGIHEEKTFLCDLFFLISFFCLSKIFRICVPRHGREFRYCHWMYVMFLKSKRERERERG